MITELLKDLIPYQEVVGRVIERVVGVELRTMNDGSLRADEVVLLAGDKALRISVIDDTDEIVCAVEARSADLGKTEDVEALAWILGKELGWGWYAWNSMGYRDVMMVAVDLAFPDLAFVVAASSIQFRRLTVL